MKDNYIDIIVSISIGLLIAYLFNIVYEPPIVIIKGNDPHEIARIIYKDEINNNCYKLKPNLSKCKLTYEI
jgi:hypothetical protein